MLQGLRRNITLLTSKLAGQVFIVTPRHFIHVNMPEASETVAT